MRLSSLGEEPHKIEVNILVHRLKHRLINGVSGNVGEREMNQVIRFDKLNPVRDSVLEMGLCLCKNLLQS